MAPKNASWPALSAESKLLPIDAKLDNLKRYHKTSCIIAYKLDFMEE